MRIPDVQAELIELSHKHGIPRLAELAQEMSRRPPRQRAPATSTPMTPELADEIRAMRKANPKMSQMDIARSFNVNPGRVSEALRGKKK